MSAFFAYIATKSTADPYLPPRSVSVETLARDVSDGFLALSGGRFEVGRISIYPVQRSVQGHLLCDGREVPKASFPELYAYLGDSQGTPADPDNFLLPDYSADFTPAVAGQPEVVVGGTVTTPPPPDPPPGYNPGQTDPIYGGVDSGGRRNPNVQIP